MANIDNVQLPDGSSYNIVDNTSGFATQNYVDSAVSSVTKTTIGLGNVDNTSDLDKPISTATQTALDEKASDTPTFTEASTRANIVSGESMSTLFGKIRKWFTDLPSMFVAKSGDTMAGNLQVDLKNGTKTQIGESVIRIGNDTAAGVAKNSQGSMRLYGSGQYFANLTPDSLTANRFAKLPNKNGTLAITSDVPAISAGAITKSSVVTALNGSVVKIGKLVIIQGVWYGSATNAQSVGQISSGYRPSADLLCSGTVRYGSDTYPCSYNIASNGTIVQQQTATACESGTFCAVYTI